MAALSTDINRRMKETSGLNESLSAAIPRSSVLANVIIQQPEAPVPRRTAFSRLSLSRARNSARA